MKLPTQHLKSPKVILPALSIVVLVVILLAIASGQKDKTPIYQPPSKKGVVAYSTPTPSEQPIAKATYVSTAAPNEPKFISLPTISESGFIEKMGIDQNNQVAAPSNVNLAGWYINSLSPGQPGLSIIDGHVDGLHGPGIFLRLSKLAIGDQFTIELGDGTIKTFQVKRTASVSDSEANTSLFSKDPLISNQLNLITCGGVFDQKSHSYLNRTIIVSELINS